MSEKKDLAPHEKARVATRFQEIFGDGFAFLEKEEQAKLIAAARAAKLSEQDEAKLVDWAHHARIDNAMLGSLLAGAMQFVKLGEDGEPVFRLTPQGEAKARAIYGLPPEGLQS